jgi:hypothetical protein
MNNYCLFSKLQSTLIKQAMKILNEMLSLHHLESFYCNIHEFKFQGVDSNKVELRKYMQLLENKKSIISSRCKF